VIISELVPRLTRWSAVEDATFALLGGWVATTADAETKLLFAEESHHHAWHASLWRNAVPMVAHDGEGLDADMGSYFDELAAEADDLHRLVVCARVLAPIRLGEYHAAIATFSPVSDGPAARAAALVVADQERDRFVAEALLDGRGDDEWAKEVRKRWPAG
jgi:hypothetical protein